ncbi:MAG: hypothetical protein EOP48_10555 [Sphingobacteriales bacterium]|nr:MAG: hypothetical protein EOP48_10555 [Sphingobacteriales bacterium]
MGWFLPAEQEIMKQDLLSTENAFLKSQINSHFLFNTLSYLHSSVLDVNQQAAQTILHLSDILRYSLTTPASGKVKLADELAYVSHIFQISKFKSSKPVHLEFTITGNPGDQQVIPLILITLAENMLKYADFYDKGNPAKFSCQITGNSLSIFVSDKKRKSVFPFNAGIGLENTKKRLNLAYQENYSLDIINADTRYELTLIIPLEDAIQNNNR